MTKCTKQKPKKPRKDFPLYAHPSGQWARKIKGKNFYFGVWTDPAAAEARWDAEKKYLLEGRTPPPVGASERVDYCTMKRLCDAFCDAKMRQYEAGELSPLSWQDYYDTCLGLVTFFGRDRRVDDLRFDDFAAYRTSLAKRLNATSLGNEITRTKVVFKYAYTHDLIEREVKYGDAFKKPPARKVREEKYEKGKKLFTREEILAILAVSDPAMKAMVLLGINAGFGNTDVSVLEKSIINFETGWIEFPRKKTFVPRLCPLWPETIAALKEAIAVRPKAANKADDGLVFLSCKGLRYEKVRMLEVKKNENGKETTKHKSNHRNKIAGVFRRVLTKLRKTNQFHNNGRSDLGFYAFRHTFETIAQRAGNQVATDAIMGHSDSSMAARYREEVHKPHLQAVVNVVHDWLFPPAAEGGEQ